MFRAKGAAWRLVLVVMAGVAGGLVVNPDVRGDGNGYYAWIASAVVDHDLDFRNQYAHGNRLFRERFEDGAGLPKPERITATGHVDNQWAVGPAVLWAPWFAAAHVVTRLTGADPQDGYAPVYRRACATGSFVYGALALWLGVLGAGCFGVRPAVAWGSALVVWGASSLLVYTLLLPFSAHAAGAFTVAWWLYFGLRRADRRLSVREWAAWGALAGLMALTYLANAVFALVAVPVWYAVWRSEGAGAAFVRAAAFLGAALVAATPHLIGKAVVYGSPWVTGYREQWHWLAPQLWNTAFSTNHGVLLWTPVMGVGLAGCSLLIRRARAVWVMVVAAAAFYLLIASYGNWHGLSSFGNRFFTAWTFLAVLGVAAIADAASRRPWTMRAAVAVGCVLVVWNVALAFQWAFKMVPNRGEVDVALVVRQQWQVPTLAISVGRRYFTDRGGLVREIEDKDEQEWDAFQKKR